MQHIFLYHFFPYLHLRELLFSGRVYISLVDVFSPGAVRDLERKTRARGRRRSRRELISLVFQNRETMLSTTRSVPIRARPLPVSSFPSFPSLPSFLPLRHLLRADGRHVFEVDKHAEASRKRPESVLSLAHLSLSLPLSQLLLSYSDATSSLWSFNVCPGAKVCDVFPHLSADSILRFRWRRANFVSATNQLFRRDFNRFHLPFLYLSLSLPLFRSFSLSQYSLSARASRDKCW